MIEPSSPSLPNRGNCNTSCAKLCVHCSSTRLLPAVTYTSFPEIEQLIVASVLQRLTEFRHVCSSSLWRIMHTPFPVIVWKEFSQTPYEQLVGIARRGSVCLSHPLLRLVHTQRLCHLQRNVDGRHLWSLAGAVTGRMGCIPILPVKTLWWRWRESRSERGKRAKK